MVHFRVIRKRRRVLMSCKRGSPQVENKVNMSSGHLVTSIEKVGHFKFDPVMIRSPVVWSTV